MNFTCSKLEELFPMADFVSAAFGKHCEVVIHDVQDLESSIIYICNGELTNRQIGESTTDYALRVIKNQKYQNKQFIANYSGKSLGGKKFRSSTFFIKNKQNELIGLFCINIEVTEIHQAISLLQSIGYVGTVSENDDIEEELLQGDPQTLIDTYIEKTIQENPIPVERWSKDEKIVALSYLVDEGVFLMKGSVAQVAQKMKLSEPTIYRYLQKIKSNK